MNEKDLYVKLDGFTIYGYNGSYAETYANENSIPFVVLKTAPITVATLVSLIKYLQGDTSYNPAYDINGDGKVDIIDVAITRRRLLGF